MHRALARIPQEDADQAREAQLARLQALRLLLWNHAGADPIKAAEALIKLEAREARLLGLDMPTKLAITDPDGGIPLEAVRRLLDRMDAVTVDITPEPAPLPLTPCRWTILSRPRLSKSWLFENFGSLTPESRRALHVVRKAAASLEWFPRRLEE